MLKHRTGPGSADALSQETSQVSAVATAFFGWNAKRIFSTVRKMKMQNDGPFSFFIVLLFFRDDASKKSENGKSLEILKIENTRLLR